MTGPFHIFIDRTNDLTHRILGDRIFLFPIGPVNKLR